EQFVITKPDDFPSFDALESYGRETHDGTRRLLASNVHDRVDDRIQVPWFKDPPLALTVTEALTQMAMHSQHHRPQNATRLRDPGAATPPTDLIVWYWKGRPAPRW